MEEERNSRVTLRAAEKMVREFEDRKEELERQGKKKKKEKRMEMREGVETARKKLMEKNQSKWCRKKHLWKWLIKPIKKTSALSSVSPVCWAENVDPTQILPQAWGIWETPIKAKRPMVLIWWGSFAMFGWKHVSTEAFWSYYMSK